ncbi:MAG: ThuA domain-containing protein [Candidatus Hydrogenedentes bacterium]|nr:ThuA domain-containing protein [Candidatus Hydrogenedentota bacterium]
MTHWTSRRPMAFAGLLLLMLLPTVQAQAPAGVGAAPIAAGHPNLPNGYSMVAHLVCEGDNANATADGVTIAQTSGERRALGPDCLPFKGEAFGNQRIEFSIDGMDSSADYLLGFTWWDTGKQGRVQSLALGLGPITDVRTVIPATVPLAFHGDQPTYARVLVPLSRGDFPSGSCEMIVEAHTGPDAVVQEVWLMKRTEAIAQKRVLIVTGDDWIGHLWRDTGPELAAILREDPRLEVSITECPAFLGSPLLERYDAVILHFKNYQERLPLDDKTWLGLTRYVQNGHGLVLVHFGCGAFQEWDGYKKIVGGIWNPEKRAHDPYGPFQVCVADAGHPITASMTHFDTQDELYTCLDTLSDIRVLFKATSKVDQVEYPMGFVVRDSERTFNCTLGHDVNALRSPGARTLYRRATLWAAGLEP